MSEIKLFKLNGPTAQEIAGEAHGLEKSLQDVFERNLDTFLGVRFLASEHGTGAVHGGRIDTLGIDENGSPVIVEYKRAISENVVSQGLYYLDWLMDHKAEFELLVLKRLGKQDAEAIDWSAPRLVCIAADFTKFDEHAIRQINRNIDLVRYRRFGSELLALELATRVSSESVGTPNSEKSAATRPKHTDKPVSESINELNTEMADLYESLRAFVMGLGDDVSEKQTKLYMAYRRIRNFMTICVPKKGLQVYLHINPDSIEFDDKIMRDVRSVGHWGTGDLEVMVTNQESLKKVQPLIERAYEGK